MTDRELIRDELEQRLMTTVPLSDDELIALMQRRIEAVQKFLVESGVAADRLFPVAPKVDAAARGEARAVFSLN